MFIRGLFGLQASMIVNRLIEIFHRAVKGLSQDRRNSDENESLLENTFTDIYLTNAWGNSESLSGNGSTLRYTENLRKELPALFDRLQVRSVLDAPCGDFNWMQHVLPNSSVDYTGGDIVTELIDRNNRLFRTERIKFLRLNIVEDRLPSADLFICRDLLFHLSFQDIFCILENFIKSDIPWLLTSSHKTEVVNTDIVSGGFRLLDLFAPPFRLSSKGCVKIDDWIPPFPERYMCLFSRDDLADSLNAMKAAGGCVNHYGHE